MNEAKLKYLSQVMQLFMNYYLQSDQQSLVSDFLNKMIMILVEKEDQQLIVSDNSINYYKLKYS